LEIVWLPKAIGREPTRSSDFRQQAFIRHREIEDFRLIRFGVIVSSTLEATVAARSIGRSLSSLRVSLLVSNHGTSFTTPDKSGFVSVKDTATTRILLPPSTY